MTDEHGLSRIARAIVDANSYMTLATADADGLPWATPVWFALANYREFFWVSHPHARHSRNVAARPQLGIVIFDSTVPIGTGQGVYMSAVAEEVSGDAELARGVDVFTRRSLAQGGLEWTRGQVVAPARHRLYRATASETFVLSDRDERIPVRV